MNKKYEVFLKASASGLTDKVVIDLISNHTDIFNGLFNAEDVEEILAEGNAWDGAALDVAREEVKNILVHYENLKVQLAPCWHCGRIFKQTMLDSDIQRARDFGYVVSNNRHRDYYCGDCHQEVGFLSDGSESETYWIILEDNKMVIYDCRH